MSRDEYQFGGLAFAGAAPFVAFALLPLFGISSIAPFGALDWLASVYGLAILSFICGTHWTLQLTRPGRTPVNLFYTSNSIFLVVGFVFVLASLTWSLVIQIAAFVVLLLIDRALRDRELVSDDYIRVRSVATAAACLSLAIIALSQ